MKNTFMAILVAGAVAREAPAVELGASREQVVAELGKPMGEATVRGRTQLFYTGGVIEISEGKVSHIDANFAENAKAVAEQKAFDAEQRAKGLVQYEGRWVSSEEAARLGAIKAAQAKAMAEAAQKLQAADAARAQKNRTTEAALAAGKKARVREVRDGGKAADMRTFLTDGKISIVDFFADWCGPCRRLSPWLEDMAARNEDIYLCKVDIVTFSSAMAQYHNLNSIPDVRVYNRSGQAVGSPTSDPAEILKNIEAARR